MLGECYETHRMRNPGFCRLTVIDSRAFRSRSSRYMAVDSSEKTFSADITERTTTDRPSTLPDHVRHHTARQSQHMPALKVLSSCSLHYAGLVITSIALSIWALEHFWKVQSSLNSLQFVSAISVLYSSRSDSKASYNDISDLWRLSDTKVGEEQGNLN